MLERTCYVKFFFQFYWHLTEREKISLRDVLSPEGKGNKLTFTNTCVMFIVYI